MSERGEPTHAAKARERLALQATEASSVVAARPDLGGGAATPSLRLPPDAGTGVPGRPATMRLRSVELAWGTRTYVMGIVNVTPDSFSGDGLLARGADPVRAAVDQARAMVDEGADLLDVGGESTRPGHEDVPAADEAARVEPVVAAIRGALPTVPISVDTTKAAVAEAALDAGADLINDVWGVEPEDELIELAAARRCPIVLMHNRREPRYSNLIAEVIADLERAIERAMRAGVAWDSIVLDPGVGFGKTADHNLVLLRELRSLGVLGRPILLGTSRKSTLGRVLDLPPDQRVEATIATTALGIASGVDIVRVHDVRANVRAARMTDAIVRTGMSTDRETGAGTGGAARGEL
jgi:dihydropteroate synthase